MKLQGIFIFPLVKNFLDEKLQNIQFKRLVVLVNIETSGKQEKPGYSVWRIRWSVASGHRAKSDVNMNSLKFNKIVEILPW